MYTALYLQVRSLSLCSSGSACPTTSSTVRVIEVEKDCFIIPNTTMCPANAFVGFIRSQRRFRLFNHIQLHGSPLSWLSPSNSSLSALRLLSSGGMEPENGQEAEGAGVKKSNHPGFQNTAHPRKRYPASSALVKIRTRLRPR